MTVYIDFMLLWIFRIFLAAVILTAVLQGVFEIPVFDIGAEVVYEFGAEVPDLVLRHTTEAWRIEHGCYIGYECKGIAAWDR